MCRSQKRKNMLDLTVFVAHLESARIKATRKLLVKLAPVLELNLPSFRDRDIRNRHHP